MSNLLLMMLAAGKVAAPTPEFISSSTAADNTTLTITLPAHNSGDLLVAFLACAAGTSVSGAPAGWTQQHLVSTSQMTAIYTKVSAGETGNVTWTLSGGGNNYATVLAYRNVTTVDVVGSRGTSSVAPGITATAPGALIAFYFVMSNSTITSAPTGMTERALRSGTQSLCAFDLIPSPAGATGDKTITWSGSGNSYGIQIQIA